MFYYYIGKYVEFLQRLLCNGGHGDKTILDSVAGAIRSCTKHVRFMRDSIYVFIIYIIYITKLGEFYGTLRQSQEIE